MLDDFLSVRPGLVCCRSQIEAAFGLLESCFASGGKLLVCGNGGSAADAERGAYLGEKLQGTLPAIALTGQYALNTAVANDNGGDLPFAQQVFGYGVPGDVLWGISTSGNSVSVALAATVAKAKGLRVLGMTGAKGGRLAGYADVCLQAPSDETFQVQEYHLAIYHFLCAALERRFFTE